MGIVAYAWWAPLFELEKYRKGVKGVEILRDVNEIMLSSEDPELRALSLEITDRVRRLLEVVKSESMLSDFDERFAVALIMAVPWAVFSLAGVVEALRREPDWEYGLFGCLAISAVLGIGSYYLVPTDIADLHRYLVIPFFFHSGLATIFYIVGNLEEDHP